MNKNKPERYLDQYTDEFLACETIITELPGGLGQVSQVLPEPLVIHNFKTRKIRSKMAMGKANPFQNETLPKRFCHNKTCNAVLPHERWYYCKKCKGTLDEDPGQMLYCGISGE